jgi:hypothetical protein
VAADPGRRAVLAATAVLPLLVAGCRGAQALGTAPEPAQGVTELRGAIWAEELMVARYQAAIRLLDDGTRSGTGRTLAGLLAEHQDHLRQLRARFVPGSPLAAGSGPLRRPPAPAAPASARQAIASLSGAELAASDRLLGGVPHVPPSLAQLFASISASEATHVPLLRALEGQ